MLGAECDRIGLPAGVLDQQTRRRLAAQFLIRRKAQVGGHWRFPAFLPPTIRDPVVNSIAQ
jgi:hypothetical protein